jgi:subtilisin family serine protease
MGGGFGVRWTSGACAAVALLAVLVLWLVGARAGASGAEQSNWPLAQLRAEEAWPVSTGQGVTIGIVDSGLDPSASAVAGKVGAMADCVGSGGEMSRCRPGLAPDVVGHGTIVASVAAQVAPGAKFVAAWVVDHGAQVVNVSIAGEGPTSLVLSPRMSDAVERAWARGVVPVLAAGNNGEPSTYGNVDALVAAATTAEGSIASYSAKTTTVKWGVAAPGAVVMVLPGGQQVPHQGTSVAAPNVAGAVALLLAHGENRDGAVQRLASTAVPCTGCGHGRIDVAAALGVVRGTPPSTAPPRLKPVPAASSPTQLAVPDPALLDQAPQLEALVP